MTLHRIGAWRRLVVVVMVVAVVGVSSTGLAGGKDRTPLAVVLSDDVHTRGDWIGTYGRHAYVLCGMRSPHVLCGGEGSPISFSALTGDRKESPPAWRSTMPAGGDRSVLLEPSGLKRTPAAWDDCGEVRALGKGPDLHIRISIPDGPFLLSLYFFEIDWIQYRAYRIRVFAEDPESRLLLETHVDNFLKGKYKRFIVIGPTKLLIIIERGQSPNAQVSGIFLDKLGFPDMELLDLTAISQGRSKTSPLQNSVPTLARMKGEVAHALERFLQSTRSATAQREYIQRERTFFRATEKAAENEPEVYYRELEKTWSSVEGRMSKALSVMPDSPAVLEVRLLKYCAAHARCDYEGARQTIRKIAASLRGLGLGSGGFSSPARRLLRDYSNSLMQCGRRAEAETMLRAYVNVCLERETLDQSRKDLVAMGKLALRASVPLPVARALSKWQELNGTLSNDERLLVGSLYYVGGKNDKALAVYKTVEPEMNKGARHRWLLVAMITALLREDRLKEARSEISRLQDLYPDAAEVDEARFRLGAYHFDKRDLAEAKECFSNLRESQTSDDYKRMAGQYLERIEHLEDIRKKQAQGK